MGWALSPPLCYSKPSLSSGMCWMLVELCHLQIQGHVVAC